MFLPLVCLRLITKVTALSSTVRAFYCNLVVVFDITLEGIEELTARVAKWANTVDSSSPPPGSQVQILFLAQFVIVTNKLKPP